MWRLGSSGIRTEIKRPRPLELMDNTCMGYLIHSNLCSSRKILADTPPLLLRVFITWLPLPDSQSILSFPSFFWELKKVFLTYLLYRALPTWLESAGPLPRQRWHRDAFTSTCVGVPHVEPVSYALYSSSNNREDRFWATWVLQNTMSLLPHLLCY